MMFSVYWRTVLITGRKISKYDKVFDSRIGGERELDWTLDLISTGDILKIKELHLVYPGIFRYAKLKITEPGTAFQFCRQVKGMNPCTGEMIDRVEAQIIGKVYDKVNGLCQGYVWDRVKGLMEYTDVDINNFPAWREGLMPPGKLSLDVLGVRL
jgi:hypothetical protein